MRNVLVTGGAGFIGSHLVNKLLRLEDANVIVVDNLSNNRQYYTTKPFGNDVSFYDFDIRNLQAMLDVVKDENIDSCIHLAAKISVAESILSPFETIDVNVNGTLSVINACSAHNVKNFIFASSAAVYGEPKFIPIPEEHVLNPSSPYGASKVAGEAIVSSFGNSNKIRNALTFRFFNVYGKGQSTEYAGVITKFADRLSRGLPPIIFGNGAQTRDFISVEDVCDGIILALKQEESGIFNLGTGIPVTLNQLADQMIALYDPKIRAIYSDRKVGDITQSCADITALKNRIGFVPSKKVASALDALYAPIAR